jgi:U3 small nucleolar RNA-associated protein 18
MVDTVGSQSLAQYSAEILSSDEEDSHGVSNMPAWHDSDDERIQVSLASNNRLRKLRRTEDEDVINGKEYSRRLRQQ